MPPLLPANIFVSVFICTCMCVSEWECGRTFASTRCGHKFPRRSTHTRAFAKHTIILAQQVARFANRVGALANACSATRPRHLDVLKSFRFRDDNYPPSLSLFECMCVCLWTCNAPHARTKFICDEYESIAT